MKLATRLRATTQSINHVIYSENSLPRIAMYQCVQYYINFLKN